MPVAVMGPLFGGRLTSPPPEVKDVFYTARVKRSPIEWGFRWLSSIPEVTVTLSGMSNTEQLRENVSVFDTVGAGPQRLLARTPAKGGRARVGDRMSNRGGHVSLRVS